MCPYVSDLLGVGVWLISPRDGNILLRDAELTRDYVRRPRTRRGKVSASHLLRHLDSVSFRICATYPSDNAM